MAKIKYYLPGTALILSGILIVVFPEILIAMFASVVILAGIGAIYIGKRLSESGQDLKNSFSYGLHDDDIDNCRTGTRPFIRYHSRWH